MADRKFVDVAALQAIRSDNDSAFKSFLQNTGSIIGAKPDEHGDFRTPTKFLKQTYAGVVAYATGNEANLQSKDFDVMKRELESSRQKNAPDMSIRQYAVQVAKCFEKIYKPDSQEAATLISVQKNVMNGSGPILSILEAEQATGRTIGVSATVSQEEAEQLKHSIINHKEKGSPSLLDKYLAEQKITPAIGAYAVSEGQVSKLDKHIAQLSRVANGENIPAITCSKAFELASAKFARVDGKQSDPKEVAAHLLEGAETVRDKIRQEVDKEQGKGRRKSTHNSEHSHNSTASTSEKFQNASKSLKSGVSSAHNYDGSLVQSPVTTNVSPSISGQTL